MTEKEPNGSFFDLQASMQGKKSTDMNWIRIFSK
jgi:hypothetical protein